MDAQRRRLAERKRELHAVLAMRDESAAMVRQLDALLAQFVAARDDTAGAAEVCAGWTNVFEYAEEARRGERLVVKPVAAAARSEREAR